MTFDGQKTGSMSVELEDWAVCKEEVSFSLLRHVYVTNIFLVNY